MRPVEYTPVQCQCQCEPIVRWVLVRWCPIHGTQIKPTKHLADAECAAEYWKARYQAELIYSVEQLAAPGEVERLDRIERVMHRFATHPHVDEENTP